VQNCGLHHGKTRPNANARPATEWEICAAEEFGRSIIKPTVGMETLGIGKPSPVTMGDPLAHQDLCPRSSDPGCHAVQQLAPVGAVVQVAVEFLHFQ